MKDLKNIIFDLWKLFFPLMIRLLLSLVITYFVFHSQYRRNILAFFIPLLSQFVSQSKDFLNAIDLSNFLAVYFLIAFILLSFIFNAVLSLLRSLIKVDIFWRGYAGACPHQVSILSRYLYDARDLRDIETEIHQILEGGKKENKFGIAESEKSFNRSLSDFSEYTDILMFELVFTIIVTITCWPYLSLFKTVLASLLLIFGLVLVLSRKALEVRSHYSQLLNKVELILSGTITPLNNNNERERELFSQCPKQWWGISIFTISDIRETFRNFKQIEIFR